MNLEEFKSWFKKPIDQYEIRFNEYYDYMCMLSYNDNEWSVLKVPSLKNDKIVRNHTNADLMEMILSDEEVGQLLDILDKKHCYIVIVQVPALHKEDIYPFIEDGKICAKIVEECCGKVMMKETSFNRDWFTTLINDMESFEQLYKILDKMDSIGTHFTGIELIDYETGFDMCVESPSYKILKNIMFDQEDVAGLYNELFKLLKRQELNTFVEVYANESNQYKDHAEYVLNVFTKKIFDYMSVALSNHPDSAKHVSNIMSMDETIRLWYVECYDMNKLVKMSPSLIIWRKMIELDIDYATMNTFFKSI